MSERACMIDVGDRIVCLYPSMGLLKLLGKDYTLLIIGLLGNSGGVGFNEIIRNVGNPRPNLLSIRLKELEGAGLIIRKVMDSKPVSVKYSLSERGSELRGVMIPLFKWIEGESSSRV